MTDPFMCKVSTISPTCLLSSIYGTGTTECTQATVDSFLFLCTTASAACCSDARIGWALADPRPRAVNASLLEETCCSTHCRNSSCRSCPNVNATGISLHEAS